MTDSKKKPERRGPESPGSPDNLKGVEKKHTNPDGATPAELPTVTPRVPTHGDKNEKED
jgi:hypothetical protein